MAFSKNRRLADLISADGTSFITSSHITDTSITPTDLHSTLDLTGKTVTVANASTGDSDTTAANTAFVQQEIAALVDSAPGTLNTLNELAASLGDDANFSTTVTNSIATKLPLAGGTLTGDLVLKSDGGDNVINVVHSGNTAQIVSIGQSGDNSGNGVIQLRRNNGAVHTQLHSHGSTYFNGGNVGIGFASGTPGALLTVKASTNTYAGGFRIEGTDETTALGITHVNGDNFFSGNATDDHITLKGNGNVGIGETAPANLLHVKVSDAGIAPHPSAQIVLERDGTNYLQFLTTAAGTSGLLFGDTNDIDVSKIYVDHNTTKMTFVNETSETMTLNGKKVLIGDSNSHVDDLLQIETPASGGGHGIQIRRNDSNGDQGIGRIMFGNNSDTDLATIQATTDGQADSARLAFFTQPTSGTSKERMRIESGGNIRQHYATDPGNNKRFTTPINPQIAQVGLQGYWDPTKANSYSGNTIYDFSPSTHGNGNQTLTKGSGVTHVTNANRAVWQFDGTSNAEMQGNPNLAAQKSCSFSFWIYFNNVNSLSSGYQINGIQIGNHYMYLGIVQGNNNNASLYSYIGQGTNIVHGSSASTQNAYINSDEWVYLTVQAGHGSSDVTGRSHGRAEVYLNGSLVTRASSIPLPTAAASSFYLGRVQGGYYLNGYMGPAVLYERTLHQWEILENMRVHADMYMA